MYHAAQHFYFISRRSEGQVFGKCRQSCRRLSIISEDTPKAQEAEQATLV